MIRRGDVGASRGGCDVCLKGDIRAQNCDEGGPATSQFMAGEKKILIKMVMGSGGSGYHMELSLRDVASEALGEWSSLGRFAYARLQQEE